MGKKVKKESETPCKETFEPLPVEGKTPATVVLLLSSPEEDILIKACEAIHAFAEKGDENRVSLLGLGALEPLCQLITHNNKLVKRNAFMALGIMATNGDVKNALKKLDVIPSIIGKLSLEVDFVSKVQIFDNKGLPPLIQLLSSPDPDVKKNSLEIIFNLVQDHQSRLAVHELGGIPPLLELLNSDFPVIQHLVLKTLHCVTIDKDTCNTFREEHGVERLMDILNNTVLVELLTVADVSVKTTTCQAMSFHTASKDSYRDLGGIPAVVQLLHSDSLVLREAATQALSSLTHGNQLNSFAVYEAGGHEILVQQLCESCPGMAANSAATLGNMAGQEVIRCSILSHGAIQALVQPLKSTNTHVLVNTTQCLAMLACDMEARAELKSAGGLQPLVNLLQSYHKDVLHNACLAINVCAIDEATTVEMCKFGALEMLQEINQSVNRRSNYSKLAMISLLNSNLSVKYSLTGCLASTDIISAGFYDAGKAQAGQRILTLEELSKQPVNQHRPIIVVNTAVVNTAAKETVDMPEERLSNPSETDTSRDRRTPRRRKKDDKQKDETRPESPIEKPWKMMDDVSLQLLVKEAKEFILPLSDEREQYAALARLVSEAMGGAVEMEKLHEFPWVLHLSELKFQLQSNVIPIGLIGRGIYYHRALLFKCLVDCIGMSCTLVRGEYNRAWNEVLLFIENASSHGRSSQPCRYIVDLMHQPGRLLAANTPAAEQYQTI
ncbi:Armadillo repeat-containing protein 3 [Nibea albiflora]|uniref:Armadillo repeat-containing protein 3 n=1 Tax=Nibea albiflora TaxID=240163 RepID=A0ACB7F4J9_NIBAL|nr:Armadillo repeat-containing protein 3 [Nibea albiflora]